MSLWNFSQQLVNPGLSPVSVAQQVASISNNLGATQNLLSQSLSSSPVQLQQQLQAAQQAVVSQQQAAQVQAAQQAQAQAQAQQQQQQQQQQQAQQFGAGIR